MAVPPPASKVKVACPDMTRQACPVVPAAQTFAPFTEKEAMAGKTLTAVSEVVGVTAVVPTILARNKATVPVLVAFEK